MILVGVLLVAVAVIVGETSAYPAAVAQLQWMDGGMGGFMFVFGTVGGLLHNSSAVTGRRLVAVLRRRLVDSCGADGTEIVAPWAQVRALWIPLTWTLLLAALVLVIAVALHFVTGIPIAQLSQDPAAVLHAPPYLGMLSNLGIILWAATAAICLFSVLILRGRPDLARARRFLAASAAFTTVLMLDDLFLLHEKFFPKVIGVPEKAVYVLYAIGLVVYLGAFWSQLLRSPYVLFILAGGFLALSVALDIVLPFRPGLTFVEDSAKFVGIALWLTYFVRTAEDCIHFSESRGGRPPAA